MKLHVNIDHVATLRQARGTAYPDPVWAAALCELAGAHGITCHLREDRRHMVDRDLRLLRQTVRHVLNLEMAPTPEMVDIACDIKPDVVTLVPEKRAEKTTEGGLDVAKYRDTIKPAASRLATAGIEVSLFIDPEVEIVRMAADVGVPRIELHTGDYCHALRREEQRHERERLMAAAVKGVGLGLHVAAGHGLDYPNVGDVAAITAITELNIGHAIIARAVFTGLDRAVRDMLETITRAKVG